MRALLALTAAVVVVDAAAAALQVVNNQLTNRAHAEVTAGLAYQNDLSEIVQYTLQAESAERGFLLTGDSSYMDPAKEAVRRAGPVLTAVERASRRDRELRSDYRRLLPLLRQRLDDLVQTVKLFQRGDVAGAVALVKTNRGNNLTLRVRALVASMSSRSGELVSTARENAVTAQVWSDRASIAAYVSSALLLVAMATLFRTYLLTEAARRESRLAQLQAERLNLAKSGFLSRVSHELRTPLNAILGFGQLLERDLIEPTELETLAQMLTAGRHLLAIVDDLLDLSRMEGGGLRLSLEPVQLAEVLAQAKSLISPAAKAAAVGIRQRPVSVELHVLADRQRLIQVLLNLFSNAVKYNRRGGNVVIAAGREDSGMVRIEVADSGSGIPSDAIPRLFTPFERLDAASRGIEGTGLGLALARGLVESMGGTLELTSETGVGTTVAFTLPQASAPAALIAGAAATTGPGVSRSLHGSAGAPSLAGSGALTGFEAGTVPAGPGEAGKPGVVTPITPGLAMGAAEGDPEPGEPGSVAPVPRGPSPSADGLPPGVAARGLQGRVRVGFSDPDGPRLRAAVSVLYIEDNPSNVRLVEQVFALSSELGLMTAGDGQRGVAMARELRPDLILLDLHLPDMSGEQVLAALRADEQLASTPVIIVSADASPVRARRLQAAGANGYLTKPFDIDQLLAAVRTRSVPSAAGDAADGTDSLLDEPIVASLRVLSANPAVGPGQIGQMLETFHIDASGMLSRVHEAVAQGDLAAVQRAAHRLAGGAGAVGAGRLRAICRALEALARDGEGSAARDLAEQLDELFEQTWSALSDAFAEEL